MKRHPVIEQDLRTIASQPLPWAELAGKVVLVSGAGGFLPAYMVELLLWLNEQRNGERPTRVVGLVRNAEKASVRFAAYHDRDDLQLIEQDVCTPFTIDGPVDYIIHAASQASPKFYGIDPVGTLLANVIGTRNLLELARQKSSKRFMFFSSGEVYGAVSHNNPAERDYGYLDPLDVRSCYGESKRMGENMAVSWHYQFGIPIVIVRPFHTYGPGMALDDGRVFADFVADVVAHRDIVMKSDGAAVRAFCYLADAVAAFFTVLLKGGDGQAYNIGNDQAESSVIDLAELLAATFLDRNIKVQRHKPPAGNAYLQSTISRICPDIAKARSLGWVPVTGLVDGFTKTIRSFEP